jgi:recombinational DNA repair protein RecR
MELFNNLLETMLEIDYIQQKIDRLQEWQSKGQISNIIISFDAGSERKILMQYDTDISLVNEIRLLLQASIELYENQIQELKLNF